MTQKQGMIADCNIVISANLLFQCHLPAGLPRAEIEPRTLQAGLRSRFPLKKMNADDAETRDDRRLQYRDQRKSPFSVSPACRQAGLRSRF
jgi:hypothetical protein